MYVVAIIFILFLVAAICIGLLSKNSYSTIYLVISGLIVTVSVTFLDNYIKNTDYEIRSGYIEKVEHIEEWDEWIPPTTTCSSNSEGNTQCTTSAGYWIHHDAENYIYTTDNGKISVMKSPDGEYFTDNYPNTSKELEKYWPIHTPSASKHRYKNKVQGSNSIYAYKFTKEEIEEFTDLPKYPIKIKDYIYVDRIIGEVPKKEKALKILSEENSRLNQIIIDEEGKKRAWKQVNLIFVNLGEKSSIKEAYALERYWEGGNKNDYIIAFSMSNKGKVNWVYPFSWSEVELLKIETRQYFESISVVTDFSVIIKDISKLVEDKFERKSFSEFNYIVYMPSRAAIILLVIIYMSLLVGFVCFKKRKHILSYDNNKRIKE